MGSSNSKNTERRLRLLVAIASYGEKNIDLLRRIIRTYQAMAMDVDVVVLSNAPKNLGSNVSVVVGLPSKNPWSLPFAHKRIFAAEQHNYDLFIYSEDDVEITEGNIKAFLALTPSLAVDEVAGFIRYEIDANGVWSVPEVHGAAHWKPETVRRRGRSIVAEFSNEHSACYVLTQSQLKTAVASGGFLREPYEGRYDMLCSAATDPYTSCGLRKVICISALDDFLVHHLPNRYAGQLGITLAELKQQIRTLVCIESGMRPASTLCQLEAAPFGIRWAKSYYEEPVDRLRQMVPTHARSVLSVGCGSGEMESWLAQSGMDVTALPLDSVIGDTAERRGIKVVYGTLEEGWSALAGRKFDCVIVTNLLHLQQNPQALVQRCSSMLAKDGRLIIAGPNFQMLPILVRRWFSVAGYEKLRRFEEGAINAFTARHLAGWLRQAGLKVEPPVWFNANDHANSSGALASGQKLQSKLRKKLFRSGKGPLSAECWMLRGTRP